MYDWMEESSGWEGFDEGCQGRKGRDKRLSESAGNAFLKGGVGVAGKVIGNWWKWKRVTAHGGI